MLLNCTLAIVLISLMVYLVLRKNPVREGATSLGCCSPVHPAAAEAGKVVTAGGDQDCINRMFSADPHQNICGPCACSGCHLYSDRAPHRRDLCEAISSGTEAWSRWARRARWTTWSRGTSRPAGPEGRPGPPGPPAPPPVEDLVNTTDTNIDNRKHINNSRRSQHHDVEDNRKWNHTQNKP